MGSIDYYERIAAKTVNTKLENSTWQINSVT